MNKNNMLAKVIIFILILIICIFGGNLILKIVIKDNVFKNYKDKINEKKLLNISYKIDKADFPLLSDAYIEGNNIYEDENYKIFINKNKKIEIEDTNGSDYKNIIVPNIENAKSLLVDSDDPSYIVLTEDGYIYMSVGYPIEIYLNKENENYNENFFEKVVSSNENYKKLYPESEISINSKSFEKILMIRNFIGNEYFIKDDYIYLGLSSNGEYYTVNKRFISGTNVTNLEVYEYNEINSTLETFIKEKNNDGCKMFIIDSTSAYVLNTYGNLSIYKNGRYLENKFLLPNGNEATIYKIAIDETNFKNPILYVITSDNKLYKINVNSNITVSSKLILTEVNNGKIVKEINYKLDNESFTKNNKEINNLKFVFEDESVFEIKKIDVNKSFGIIKGGQ